MREYFLFDPTGRLPVPTLHGYRLSRVRPPQRLPAAPLPNGRRGLYSEVLKLYAYVLDKRTSTSRAEDEPPVEMRWHDPVAGTDLPSLQGSMDRTRWESARAEREAAARQSAGRTPNWRLVGDGWRVRSSDRTNTPHVGHASAVPVRRRYSSPHRLLHQAGYALSPKSDPRLRQLRWRGQIPRRGTLDSPTPTRWGSSD